MLEKHDIYVSGFRPKWSYNSHGYTLAFFLTVKSIGVDQPDGYSKEAAAGIAKNYVSDKAVPATNISKKNPNIIVVMNEAYADLSYISKFSTNPTEAVAHGVAIIHQELNLCPQPSRSGGVQHRSSD